MIFVTGTDTGVGKTIFTALLVHHLRVSGVHALAMKPFCSGGRADVRLLRAMQDAELSEDEINPFFFAEPVAPLVSARRHGRSISMREVLRKIHKISRRCDCLLIEGAGGLLVPIGENFLVSDVIRELECEVFVVARNRLGTINHTLLTLSALRSLWDGVKMPGNSPRTALLRKPSREKITSEKKIQIVLMETGKRDRSCATNETILRELSAPVPVWRMEFLGEKANKNGVLKKKYKKMKKTLARICG